MTGCAVWQFYPAGRYAICDCGYVGRFRWFVCMAKWDAYAHCATTGCDVKLPLVRQW